MCHSFSSSYCLLSRLHIKEDAVVNSPSCLFVVDFLNISLDLISIQIYAFPPDYMISKNDLALNKYNINHRLTCRLFRVNSFLKIKEILVIECGQGGVDIIHCQHPFRYLVQGDSFIEQCSQPMGQLHILTVKFLLCGLYLI